MAKPEKHHEIGPSIYPALLGCMAYRRTPERESAEASEGTKAHEELSRAITDGIEPDNDSARWAADELKSLACGAEIESEKTLSRTICGEDIFGTADAVWRDADGHWHVADFKTFSDGTTDYTAQLMGYAAMLPYEDAGKTVHMHILHGMIRKTETVEATHGECLAAVTEIVSSYLSVKSGRKKATRNICKWCAYCANIGTCPAACGAVQTVNENGLRFNSLTTCQKLVVLDAVDKLSKTIREQAKAEAIANGGTICDCDKNGNVSIKYEMRPWAGPAKCRDIRLVAEGMHGETPFAPLNDEELLAACTLSKSALSRAIREKNPDRASVKNRTIDTWVDGFYEKTEGSPHFVRVV